MAVAVPLVLFACRNQSGYRMHIGQPFYPFSRPSSARILGTDLLRNRPDEPIRMRGIYTAPDSGLIAEPMIRTYREVPGLCYAILSASLDVPDGDLIEVQGQIVQREGPAPGGHRMVSRAVLEPEDVAVLHCSSELKQVVQAEYSKLRPWLQEQMTPQGSRLLLPEQPRWYIVRAEADSTYIISARAGDLMYEAEIDVVLAGPAGGIKDIYAVEWFKGE